MQVTVRVTKSRARQASPLNIIMMIIYDDDHFDDNDGGDGFEFDNYDFGNNRLVLSTSNVKHHYMIKLMITMMTR